MCLRPAMTAMPKNAGDFGWQLHVVFPNTRAKTSTKVWWRTGFSAKKWGATFPLQGTVVARIAHAAPKRWLVGRRSMVVQRSGREFSTREPYLPYTLVQHPRAAAQCWEGHPAPPVRRETGMMGQCVLKRYYRYCTYTLASTNDDGRVLQHFVSNPQVMSSRTPAQVLLNRILSRTIS